jgi:hypothetical protein
MTNFEIDSFILSIENEALNISLDLFQLLKYSSFYRIISSFRTINKNNRLLNFPFKTFIELLVSSTANRLLDKIEFKVLQIVKNKVNDTLIIKSDYNSLEEKQVFVNYFTIEGVILKKDLEVCKVLYKFFSDEYNSYIYKNAIIKGCKVRSRGFKYRECNEATIAKKSWRKNYSLKDENDVTPTNQLNILKNNWFFKNQFSSWCKFKYKDNFINQSTIFFGQLNFFFNISIPDDHYFNQVGFASVTSRSFWTDDKFGLQKINCSDEISFASTINFIPIRLIVPTAILIAGFDIDDKPFSKYRVRNSKSKVYDYLSEKQKIEVCTLVLIDLDPSQNLIEYDD